MKSEVEKIDDLVARRNKIEARIKLLRSEEYLARYKDSHMYQEILGSIEGEIYYLKGKISDIDYEIYSYTA